MGSSGEGIRGPGYIKGMLYRVYILYGIGQGSHLQL